MNSLISLILTVFLFLGNAASETPQRCDEVQLNSVIAFSSNNTYQISITIKVDKIGQSNLVSISNFSSTTIEAIDSLDFACISFNGSMICPSNNAESDTATGVLLGNQSFSLWAHLSDHNTTIPLMDLLPFYGGLADEGSLSSMMGAMFTPDDACTTDFGIQGEFKVQ